MPAPERASTWSQPIRSSARISAAVRPETVPNESVGSMIPMFIPVSESSFQWLAWRPSPPQPGGHRPVVRNVRCHGRRARYEVAGVIRELGGGGRRVARRKPEHIEGCKKGRGWPAPIDLIDPRKETQCVHQFVQRHGLEIDQAGADAIAVVVVEGEV